MGGKPNCGGPADIVEDLGLRREVPGPPVRGARTRTSRRGSGCRRRSRGNGSPARCRRRRAAFDDRERDAEPQQRTPRIDRAPDTDAHHEDVGAVLRPGRRWDDVAGTKPSSSRIIGAYSAATGSPRHTASSRPSARRRGRSIAGRPLGAASTAAARISSATPRQPRLSSAISCTSRLGRNWIRQPAAVAAEMEHAHQQHAQVGVGQRVDQTSRSSGSSSEAGIVSIPAQTVADSRGSNPSSSCPPEASDQASSTASRCRRRMLIAHFEAVDAG